MKTNFHIKSVLAVFILAGLIFAGCNSRFVSSSTRNQQYILDASQVANKEIDSFISPYRDSLEQAVDKVLAESEAELTIGRAGVDLFPSQVALGNFMTDVILTISKQRAKELQKPAPIVSFFTWGSFRKSLPSGEITLRNVFELMPFENELVVLKLSGSQLKTLLSQISRSYNPVSGVTMKADDTASILIDGKPVRENEFYQIVASDYHASGGDNLSILLEAFESYFCGIKVRDAIVMYLQQLTSNNQTLKPDYGPRITK